MKKNLFRLFSLLAVSLVGTTALVAVLQSKFVPITNIGTPDPNYSIVLNDVNAPFFETTYDKELGPEQVVENGDYTLKLKYRLAKGGDDCHVILAPHGYMYNEVDESTRKNKVSGLLSITANYTSSSSISVRTSLTDDGKEFGAPRTLPNHTPVSFDDNPYYFIIEAGDSEATIESVVLNYTCQEHTAVALSTLDGTYTGKGTDNYIYKMTLGGGNVRIESLDKETNVSAEGTAEIISTNSLKCTLDSGDGWYYFTVSENHQVFTFSSKGGTANSKFPEIHFYRVYKVENFEGYSATGEGFGGKPGGVQRGDDSIYDMTGLRAHWHADWYTGNSMPISYFGDSGWKVMGSTDFLSYSATGGHNGSKAAVFKGNTNGLRYVQMKAPLGLPNIIGRGAYLSFWAKPATNATLTTDKTTDTNFKVNVFYNKQVTKSNISTKTAVDVNIPGSSGWQRYVIALDSSKTYYSFGFYDNKGAQVYLGIDDVEIYTHDPYAEYVAPTPVTGVSLDKTELELEVGQNSTLTATVAPADATNKQVNWTTTNSSVATVNDGVVAAIGAGSATITATTADGGFTASCAVTVTAASSAPYPTGSYKGTATVLGTDYEIVIALGNRSNGLIAVRLSNQDAVATGITYDDDTQQFSITTTGSYSGYAFGTITGGYDDANDRLVNIACGGAISAGVSNNGNITATKLTVWDCDGTTEQLRNVFIRRYMSGSWQVDNSNSDRITSNTTEFVSGTGSVTRRGWTGGEVALNFKSDFSPAKSVKNVQFWVYNPSGSDITLRMWYYEAVSFGSNGETGSVTAKAGQWTYVAMGFGTNDGKDNRTIYNFQIADFAKTGVYLSFDNIALF